MKIIIDNFHIRANLSYMRGAISKFNCLAIFLCSMLMGGVSYLGAVTLIHNSGPLSVPSLFSDKKALTGEMELFAVTKKPVDLSFDKNGTIYLLDHSGQIIRCTTNEESDTQQLSKFFDVGTRSSALAFHPDYLIQYTPGYGKIYISCAEVAGTGTAFEPLKNEQHQEVIYELSNLDPEGIAFAGDIREVLRVSAEQSHDRVITDLTFDNVGHLYIGITDTVSESRAADLGSIYGKVLRIDPTEDKENGGAYSIPDRNPFFYVSSSLKELWSYGLRDPHSICHDPFQGTICISDTGEEMFEEINFSQGGAEFFGWNIAEGSFFVPAIEGQPVSEGVITPKVEYSRHNGLGRNVGGIIYRGERFPHLDGKSIFADESGRLMISDAGLNKHASKISLLLEGLDGVKVNSLKQGPSGEMFLLCDSGEIYELTKHNPYKKFSRGSMLAMIAL